MGVACITAIVGATVAVAGLVAKEVDEANARNDAKAAADKQAAAAAATQTAAQKGAATLTPEIQAEQGVADQTAAANGIGNQSSVFNQQQGLANQLQAAANGQGPNPALAQLAQTTQANTANTAALMAGQRGAGSNAGLMARQIGQQGAATQQQAVGQGATLEANQQIAARQQLSAQQAQMGNLASTQAGQQLTAQQQATQAAIQQQGLAQGLAIGNQTNANQAQSTAQAAAQAQANATAQAGGAIATGIGAAAQSPGFAPASTGVNNTADNQGTAEGTAGDADAVVPMEYNGGLIEAKAQGGIVGSGPKSYVASSLYGQPAIQLKMAMGGKVGKKVPAIVSPGERYLPPQEVKKVVQGSKEALAAGMKIKGKAKVKGDSPTNDTVPKTLEEGGVVIPRTVVNSDKEEAAKKFVLAAKSKGKK